jgi:hypothetical protein
MVGIFNASVIYSGCTSEGGGFCLSVTGVYLTVGYERGPGRRLAGNTPRVGVKRQNT